LGNTNCESPPPVSFVLVAGAKVQEISTAGEILRQMENVAKIARTPRVDQTSARERQWRRGRISEA
jgi:hypothetical protein